MLIMDHGRCATKGEARVSLFEDLRNMLIPFDVVHVTRDSGHHFQGQSST